jgi:hypothetical protein
LEQPAISAAAAKETAIREPPTRAAADFKTAADFNALPAEKRRSPTQERAAAVDEPVAGKEPARSIGVRPTLG